MKNLTLKTSLAIVAALMFATPAFGATLSSFSPTNINVTAGQNFSVVVSVNPNGVANYAEKIEVNFPADKLQVTSFTLAPNWMALTQSGYDSMDNTNGVLVKTAGYPSGISSQTVFGTISFHAIKTGAGTISLGNTSAAFSVNSQSQMVSNATSFTIGAPVSTPVTKTVTTSAKTTTVSTATTSNQPAANQNASSSQTAAAASAVPGTTSGSNAWIWIVGIIAIIAIGGGAYFFMKKS